MTLELARTRSIEETTVDGPRALAISQRTEGPSVDTAAFFESESEAKAYVRGIAEPAYRRRVEQPLDEAFRALLEALRPGELSRFRVLLDLGPGDARRSGMVLASLANAPDRLLYVPVDVNVLFLRFAMDRANGMAIPSMPFVGRFDKASALVRELRRINSPLLFCLGTTFLNMSFRELRDLGALLFRAGDGLLLSTLSPLRRARLDEDHDAVPYYATEHEELSRISLPKLVSPMTGLDCWEYRVRCDRGVVNIGFELANGPRVSVLRSYRYGEHELRTKVGYLGDRGHFVFGEMGAGAVYLVWR